MTALWLDWVNKLLYNSTRVNKQTRFNREMKMTDRISHNSLIKNDLTSAGFSVRWTFNDRLIVSLNRHLSTSEVLEALFVAGYEAGMFTACSNGSHGVVVDAVGTLDRDQCKVTTVKAIRSLLTEGIDDGI